MVEIIYNFFLNLEFILNHKCELNNFVELHIYTTHNADHTNNTLDI